MYLSPWCFFRSLIRLGSNHLKLNRRQIAAIALLLFTLLGAGTVQSVGRERTVVQTQQSEEEAKRLVEQINKLRAAAKYAEAIPLAERLIEMVEKEAGTEHVVVAQLINGLAELYRMTQNFVRAEPLYQRALATRQKLLGPEHPDVAVTLNNFALLYIQKRDYRRAEPLLQRAISIHEKIQEASPSDFALSLTNLGYLYKDKAEYGQAEALFIRSLTISEKALGPNDPVVAIGLNHLARLYQETGEYERAEPLYMRSLGIREKALGPQHPNVAESLNNLGNLHSIKGDYVAAEPLLQRAIVIYQKALGEEHLDVANPLLNLAEVYKSKGDTTRAEPLLLRAFAIREKTLGADHPDVANVLNNLADLYRTKNEYARAEQFYQRSLAIAEKTLGPDHPEVGTVLGNLAGLYELKNDLTGAEMMYQRAIRIDEKAFGPHHPKLAYPLNNLGQFYSLKGDPQRAEPLLQRTLAIFEKSLGPDHPNVSSALHNLASLYDEKRDLATAIKLQTRSNEIVERNLALTLTTGSEEQKTLFLDTLGIYTHYTVSLNTRRSPDSPEATRLAFTTILRRKGRALDAASDQIGALRRRLNPQDRELLDQLSSARSKLAALVLTGAGTASAGAHQEVLAKYKTEVERLEEAVSKRSTEFRANAQPVTIEAIQEALPADSALIEFVLYRPFNLRGKITERIGPPRYVAYVLRRQGPPAWIDLGEAVPIDNSVTELRKALSTPQSTNVKQVARTLDQQIMRPVRKLLGETRRVFLSPDSALNLIPFGALVDEQNRYLVENYSLTYLTSGRDLLRLQVKTDSKQGPVVIANPQFDEISGSQSASTSEVDSRRSIDFAQVQFGPLKGTGEEAQALARILPNVKILTEAEATEGAIKRLAGPSILHVATHGFFLPDQPTETITEVRGLGLEAKTTSAMRRETPFIRSGLALAGANKRQGKDGEDGILTALEASGLDLWGTKLVVLSACETGIGEVKNGEGVYGLRRALVLAGAESQVISLRQVSDEATRDLMIAFYERLQAGEGRTAALSAVQLEMLRSNDQAQTNESRGITLSRTVTKKDRSHPFFWASFIQSGDWRSMAAQKAYSK